MMNDGVRKKRDVMHDSSGMLPAVQRGVREKIRG